MVEKLSQREKKKKVQAFTSRLSRGDRNCCCELNFGGSGVAFPFSALVALMKEQDVRVAERGEKKYGNQSGEPPLAGTNT